MPELRQPAPVILNRRDDYTPLEALSRPYVRDEDDVESPAEIVARLHAEIAAKSPEHAAIVARFERQQREAGGLRW